MSKKSKSALKINKLIKKYNEKEMKHRRNRKMNISEMMDFVKL